MHLLKNNDSKKSKLYIYTDEPPKSTVELVKILETFSKKGSGIMLPYFLAYPIGLIGDLISTFLKINIPITTSRINLRRPTNFRPSMLNKENYSKYTTHDAKRNS